MEINNLRKYVSEANPEVNQLLRNDMNASEYTFDSLFKKGIVPKPLYRLINNEHILIQDGIFTDKGYLSCTSDFDSFIHHVEGVDVACLQLDIPGCIESIDVHALLPDHNNEKEIILPRGLRFRIETEQHYTTYCEIQNLLDNVGSISSAKEICDLYNIKTIHYYKLTLPEH